MRQDLSNRLTCIYDASTASVIAEPPPTPVATIPVSPPALIWLAYVFLQPWPPPVLLVLSAVKPGVYNPLSEGFKGEGEISNTYTLPLFQIRHFILTDLRLALSRGRGGERVFGEYGDDFYPEVLHLQLVTIVNALNVEALDL